MYKENNIIKLKPITEKSWLVLTDDEQQRVALLSEQRGKFVLIAKDVKTIFTDKQEVRDFFSEDIFDNLVVPVVLAEDISHFINGFPVDFETPYEVLDVESDLPLYTKTKKSKVYYSAGYYCLQFPKGWIGAWCLKLATLEKYPFHGPYKDEKEMKFNLSKLKKS